MRIRIAVTVGQSMREVSRGVLETWLNLRGDAFEHFVGEVCGWGVDDTGAKGKGAIVRIPVNKENEAKGTVVRESVHFDRKSCRHSAGDLRGKSGFRCNQLTVVQNLREL